jgi:hypothetical protein
MPALSDANATMLLRRQKFNTVIRIEILTADKD